MERKRENEANIREKRGEKGRKDEEKFGVHGDRGWFTAVSGFLASYLQDHPSRASLPSKTKRDDFISDLPEAEHRGN